MTSMTSHPTHPHRFDTHPAGRGGIWTPPDVHVGAEPFIGVAVTVHPRMLIGVLDGRWDLLLRTVPTAHRGDVGLVPAGGDLVYGSATLSDVHGPKALADVVAEQHRTGYDSDELATVARHSPLFLWQLEDPIVFPSPLRMHNRPRSWV